MGKSGDEPWQFSRVGSGAADSAFIRVYEQQLFHFPEVTGAEVLHRSLIFQFT